MILWLSNAGSAHGVTDDESQARTASADSHRKATQQAATLVESATLVTGVRTLTMIYRSTGTGG